MDSKLVVGGKTKNLKRLMDAGFRVPAFIAITSTELKKIFPREQVNEAALHNLVAEIQKKLPCTFYAVRSSALVEDSVQQSFAGQFKTKIRQSGDQLAEAITEVVLHAYEFLHGSLDQFSVLIQEYVAADYAGICFTRNPLKGREMVIEYHRGIGEDIVSGKITPTRVEMYWNQPKLHFKLPGAERAIESFKKIEELFSWPQDIEWCIKDGTWYFLQSRPITTLTKTDYEESLFLDRALPVKAAFFFEKTAIAEIAPRPTAFTLSLLRKIYGQNGPIQKVYDRSGVGYTPRDFFQIVGSELFVNREEEVHTLLPSYSYLSSAEFEVRLATLRGFFTTLRNMWAVERMGLDRYDVLATAVEKKLNAPAHHISFSDCLGEFLHDYETIFEVNLLAEKTVSLVQHTLHKETVSLAALLTSSKKFLFDFDDSTWLGNCLEVADESPFKKILEEDRHTAPEIEKWFSGLSSWKKKLYAPRIEMAQKFNILREYGRYVTVKKVSELRTVLLNIAAEKSFADPRSIYFATLDEITSNQYTEATCLKRKEVHAKFSLYSFPSRLTHTPTQTQSSLLSVSPGKARGPLVAVDQLTAETLKLKPILYTTSLTPDLTRYFEHISGIVSESGGMLSHLAIVAREKNIPVIVHFNLRNSGLTLGDIVEIDMTQSIAHIVESSMDEE